MKMRVSTTSICICAVLVLSLPLFAQFSQQGPKLTATATLGNATQGFSVSVSGGGSTAIVGAPFDADRTGAAWIWNRSGQNWTLGAKLVSPEASGAAYQGYSAAISGDGLTAIVGGPGDTTTTGAAWIWVRDGGNWTQQAKLVGSGSLGRAQQGVSVALSGDGNTAIVGGPMTTSTAQRGSSPGVTECGANRQS